MISVDGLRDLLASERGVYALIVTAIATALLYTGQMTVDQWTSYTITIGSVLIIGKTITTGIEIVKRPPAPATQATPSNPATPPAPAPTPATVPVIAFGA